MVDIPQGWSIRLAAPLDGALDFTDRLHPGPIIRGRLALVRRRAFDRRFDFADGLRRVAINFVNFNTEFPFFRDEVLPRLERLGVRPPQEQ